MVRTWRAGPSVNLHLYVDQTSGSKQRRSRCPIVTRWLTPCHSRIGTLPALTVVAGALVGARRPQSSATRSSRRRVEDLRPPRACSCSR